MTDFFSSCAEAMAGASVALNAILLAILYPSYYEIINYDYVYNEREKQCILFFLNYFAN